VFATRVYHYRQPSALTLGLKELRKQGLTPRGVLFIALDPRGEAYVVVPQDLDAVESIRVGDKLSLVSPLEGRFFYFDAVHRLPRDQVLWNGDRRLGDTGSAPEIAVAVSAWLKGSSAKNVFLGCTPHVPGSWWTIDHRSAVTDLHTLGFLDCVVASHGILARKIDDPRLFLLGFATLAQHGHPGTGWAEVFTSDLGNILLVERRVLHYRIVLTCERGLLEIDISHLPDLVIETARVPMRSGFGVVGRVDNGAFAVTTGTIEPWGLTNMRPATLVGSPIPSLLELPRMLEAMPDPPAAATPDDDAAS
jgi:hypothetical protein